MGLVDRDEAALPPPPVQGMEGPQPYIAPLTPSNFRTRAAEQLPILGQMMKPLAT